MDNGEPGLVHASDRTMKMSNENKKIGIIVNPVAGMGGSVGLKGTDGEMYHRSLKLGAEPVSPNRMKDVLIRVERINKADLLVAPGSMGSDIVSSLNLHALVIGTTGKYTNAEDTRRICRQMAEAGADIIVFAGGDGTARDILDEIGTTLPVVAVPAGVKVFSSVFATSPTAAAGMIDAFISGNGFLEQEVLDIDEEAYRNNRLSSSLYGYLMVPDVPRFLQMGKAASDINQSAADNKVEIAEYVTSIIKMDELYLLGPGTTVQAITEILKQPKTLLGVDAMLDEKVIQLDLSEKEILMLIKKHKTAKIIVTPLGGNGYIFGRGNKQFTPRVIWEVGKTGILVIANEAKIRDMDCLRVDTGDDSLDHALTGYIEVIIGYMEKRVMRVAC